MLKLYGFWRSTAAYRVRIVLALKGIKYERYPVHLVKAGGEQHGEAFQAINAMQLVPTLVDGELKLSQSMAIAEYLEESYPQHPLMPKALKLKAKVRELAQTVACDIHPLNNLRVLQYLKGDLAVTQTAIDSWYHHWVKLGFEAIEKKLNHTAAEFCFANTLTLADVFLTAQVYNAHRFKVDMTPYPLISAINSRCLTLAAFQDALPENQSDAVK